jgi:hypothetical protein
MKTLTILLALVLSLFAVSTAHAETWSCATIGVNNTPVLMVYKRVGDHFEHVKFSNLKFQILHESRRILVMANIDARENQEVLTVAVEIIDKIKGDYKVMISSMWSEGIDLRQKGSCQKS